MSNLPETEQKLKIKKTLDQLSTEEALKLMISEQNKGIFALSEQIEEINKVIEISVKHLKNFKNSRIIYCGAGTSGRIGVQDGAELYPTFGWPNNRLEFIIAGGPEALVKSIEGAEDDILMARQYTKNINLCHTDLVFCITASGNTPFTCEICRLAQNKKALTVSISNNKFGEINKFSKHNIFLDTKAEVITGSTRLKAGTSQKACVNIISSLVMVKLGFVKNGLMTNVVVSNKKLKDRKLRIQKELKKSFKKED